jgi:hypothetical protein
MGIQITIAQNHTKSELNFFENWDDWTRQLRDFDVEARFLWIREATVLPRVQTKAAGTHRWGGKTIIVPQFTLINATVESINKDIGGALERARTDARRGQSQLGGVDYSDAYREMYPQNGYVDLSIHRSGSAPLCA